MSVATTVVVLSVAVASAVSVSAMVKVVVTVWPGSDLIYGWREHQGVQRRGDHGGGAGVGIDARCGVVTAAAQVRQRAVRRPRTA